MTMRNEGVNEPISSRCPACLAKPGERCYATSTDEPRLHLHKLRRIAAADRLVPCECCDGLGWKAVSKDDE